MVRARDTKHTWKNTVELRKPYIEISRYFTSVEIELPY